MPSLTLDSPSVEFVGYLICSLCAIGGAVVAAFRSKPLTVKIVTILICLATAAPGLARVARLNPGAVAALDLTRAFAWLAFVLSSLQNKKNILDWIRAHRVPTALTVAALAGLPTLEALAAPSGTSLFVLLAPWQIGACVLMLFSIENVIRNARGYETPLPLTIYYSFGLVSIFEIIFFANTLALGGEQTWLRSIRGFALVLAACALFPRRSRQDGHAEFALSRHAIFHSTVLLAAGTYLVVLSVTSELFRLNEGALGISIQALLLAIGAAGLTALFRSTSARSRAMVFIGKHFFRLKYDYREVWLKFIRQMAGPDLRETLHYRTLRAVADAVQCGSGALWTFQQPIETYVGTAHWNQDTLLPMMPAEGSLPLYLLRTGWIIDIDQCLEDPEFYDNIQLPRWMERQKNLWVVVPLIHNGVLEGLITLGDARSKPQRLSWEELDLLKTVGAQAAGYLAEDRAARELADARRLAEFNRRFAFVVHDIKNVVGQMSLMLKNAERFGDNPDFQQDMLVTTGSAVERLRGMLVQLGGKSSFSRPEAQSVDLMGLVTDATDRWKRLYGDVSCAGTGSVQVMAVPEKVVSILDHLIQNSVDAAGVEGCIRLVVSEATQDGIVEVSDNGPGMSVDFVKNQLFRPFETSKPGGSGLGAFQALRMVREMGGNLEVVTNPGRGTAIRVRLPKEALTQQHGTESLIAPLNG